MNRFKTWAVLATLAWAGCKVSVVGAPCDSDENCPVGQHCGPDKKCAESSGAADGGGATDGGGSCPAAGAAVGSGCASAGAKGCDAAKLDLLACTQIGGCLVWQLDADCSASGLACGAPAGGAKQCVCSPSTSDLYVDSVNGSDGQGPNVATGAENPPSCRLKTLGYALGKAQSGARVIATGASLKPAWRPSTWYKANDLMAPSFPNGRYYKCVSNPGGTSGATEPSWPTPGTVTQVSDGTVIWSDAGADPSMVFGAEVLPLTVPGGVILTTSDCLSTAGCDPRGYVIAYNDATKSSVLAIADGAKVSGFLVLSAVSTASASSALSCNAGLVTIESLWALGANKTSGFMQTGLSISGTCAASTTGMLMLGFSNAGVLVDTSSTAPVSLDGSYLGANTVGLLIRNGNVVSGAAFGVLNSTAQGVAVEPLSGAAAPSLNATGLVVAGSGQAGMRIGGSAGNPSGGTVVVTNGDIHDNGTKPGSVPGPGIRLLNGSLTLVGTQVRNNGEAGVRVEGGSVVLGMSSSGARTGLSSNGGAGLYAGAQVSADSVDITSNGGAGVEVVELSGRTVQVVNSHIFKNNSSGVYVRSALGSLTLAKTDIEFNQQFGILCAADLGSVRSLRIEASTVHDNAQAGIQIAQGQSTGTIEYIIGNKVYRNAGGGIVFATASSLQQFEGNKICNNPGAQVSVLDAPPSSQPSWNLGLPWGTGCGTGRSNFIFGYQVPNGTGISAKSPNNVAYNVDAQYIEWQNNLPILGRDYQAPTTISVNAANPCQLMQPVCP